MIDIDECCMIKYQKEGKLLMLRNTLDSISYKISPKPLDYLMHLHEFVYDYERDMGF